MSRIRIHTLGHSDRTIEAFLDLLEEHALRLLVDVRRYPGSRRHPQFSGGALAGALGERGLRYLHLPGLGGYRGDGAGSRHRAWKEPGFRAYAAHMESAAFREELDRLLEAAGREATAVMCAEASPWHCHRQLLADALVVREVEVIHVLGPGSVEPHRMPSFARREGLDLVYDGGLLELDLG